MLRMSDFCGMTLHSVWAGKIEFVNAFNRPRRVGPHKNFLDPRTSPFAPPSSFVGGSGHRKVGSNSERCGASIPPEGGTPNPRPPVAGPRFGVPPSGGHSRRFAHTPCSRSFSWPRPLRFGGTSSYCNASNRRRRVSCSVVKHTWPHATARPGCAADRSSAGAMLTSEFPMSGPSLVRASLASIGSIAPMGCRRSA